jgi:hypothetical protein
MDSFLTQDYIGAITPENNITVISGPRLTKLHPWADYEEFRSKATVASALATTCDKETTSFSGTSTETATHELTKSGDYTYITGMQNVGAESTFVTQKKK